MNIWKQNIVPPKSLKVNLNIQMIPTIPILIKAEGGAGEKEKQDQYTTEFFKLFHLYRKKM